LLHLKLLGVSGTPQVPARAAQADPFFPVHGLHIDVAEGHDLLQHMAGFIGLQGLPAARQHLNTPLLFCELQICWPVPMGAQATHVTPPLPQAPGAVPG
jgi:hypothetical protein